MSGGMSKRPNPHIRIDDTQPQGPITDADPPIPVQARIKWVFDPRPNVVDAWAMAWTRTEVLVYFRTPGVDKPSTHWLPAAQVRRRPPG